MSDTDTRDRVIRLETELAHAVRKIDSMDTKVTEMHGLLLRSQGAVRASRWIWNGGTVVLAFLVSQFGGYIHLPK